MVAINYMDSSIINVYTICNTCVELAGIPEEDPNWDETV